MGIDSGAGKDNKTVLKESAIGKSLTRAAKRAVAARDKAKTGTLHADQKGLMADADVIEQNMQVARMQLAKVTKSSAASKGVGRVLHTGIGKTVGDEFRSWASANGWIGRNLQGNDQIAGFIDEKRSKRKHAVKAALSKTRRVFRGSKGQIQGEREQSYETHHVDGRRRLVSSSKCRKVREHLPKSLKTERCHCS